MRVLFAVTPVAVVLATTLALPSCSSDSPAAATALDSGGGGGADGNTSVDPPSEAGPPVDASVAPVDYRSGTRLRVVSTTGGSVRLFSRFHDSMLGVDCTFETLGDGATHCVPTSKLAGSVLFTDAGCTQKIVGWVTTCAPPTPDKYALYTKYDVACPSAEVLELGVASPPAMTYEMNNGSCNPYAGPALTYRSVTRTVPPSELVAATVSREPRGKQLSATYFDGADGSRQLFGLEDSAPHAGPCAEATIGHETTLRCAPKKLAFIEGYFSDATCNTIPAAYAPGYGGAACKSAPVAILASAVGTCSDYEAKYFDVGAKLPDTVYQGVPASCMAAAPQGPGTAFYAQGAAIAESAFAVMKHAQSVEKPLAVDITVTETGEKLEDTSLWDPNLAGRCAGRQATDGKTRCMGRTIDSPTFADAACQQPLAVVYHRAPGCSPPVPAQIWTEAPAANNCGAPTVRGFVVGAKVTPAQIYSGSSCTPLMPDTVNADYFAMTRELAPTELVELTDVTE
jgi:hypothetical protein